MSAIVTGGDPDTHPGLWFWRAKIGDSELWGWDKRQRTALRHVHRALRRLTRMARS